jgi:hypothetical protein
MGRLSYRSAEQSPFSQTRASQASLLLTPRLRSKGMAIAVPAQKSRGLMAHIKEPGLPAWSSYQPLGHHIPCAQGRGLCLGMCVAAFGSQGYGVRLGISPGFRGQAV